MQFTAVPNNTILIKKFLITICDERDFTIAFLEQMPYRQRTGLHIIYIYPTDFVFGMLVAS